MELTDRQQRILDGADGPFLATCMRWLVQWGDAMGARRLVPTTNVHALVTVPGNLVTGAGPKPLENTMDLLRSACEHCVACHSTTHITFAHEDQYDEIEMPAEQVAAQREVMEMARRAGFLMTLTCAPYVTGNVPLKGEICAWTESSAVVYANSILGARTTRHGTESAIAAALLGCVPEFGVLLDENRRATLQIDVTAPLRSPTDWGALGYFAGQKAGLEIPVFQGAPRPSQDDAKQLCAALASGGGVTMCHIAGVTPGAATLEEALGGHAPRQRFTFGGDELQQTYGRLRTHTGDDVDTVILGCPHASLQEVAQIARQLEGKRIAEGVTLWVCMAHATRAMADRLGYAAAIQEAGGYVFVDTCPTNSMRVKAHRIATPGFKQAHYARGMIGAEVIVDHLDACLQTALTGTTTLPPGGSASKGRGGRVPVTLPGRCRVRPSREREGDLVFETRSQTLEIRCRGLVGGKSEGQALVAPATLSFWGEVDPVSGRIIASGHPLEGETLRGRVLIIRSTKGSSGTPFVMGLAHAEGNAPVAMVNTVVDALAVLGCVVNEIPMVTDPDQDPFACVETGDRVTVDADAGRMIVEKAGQRV